MQLSWRLWIKHGGCKISSAVGFARPIVWCVMYVAAMNLRRLQPDLRFPDWVVLFLYGCLCGVPGMRGWKALSPHFLNSTFDSGLLLGESYWIPGSVFFHPASWRAWRVHHSTAPGARVDPLVSDTPSVRPDPSRRRCIPIRHSYMRCDRGKQK